MKGPKISIIVPVYNVEQYISRCIDSVLNQTFTDFELLLIDDGSPDKSGEICDEYALKDNRIRVFHKSNGGVSSARNLGLDNAIGEWIYFVDSDDIIFEDALETFLIKVSKDYDCLMGGYVVVDNNNQETKIPNKIELIWDYKNALMDFYKPKFFQFNGYLWNRIFRHSIIKQNRLRFHEDIYYKEDGLFLVEFICISKKDVFVTTKPVYKYYINPQGAMQSLKLNFDPKFLTNMDARILCYKSVKSVILESDYKLNNEAQLSIIKIYDRICNLMKLHKINGLLLRISLFTKMMYIISFRLYFKFRFSNFINTFIHK